MIGTGGTLTETSIQANGSGACISGLGGTCEIVDTTVSQPNNEPITTQVSSFVYYYVVTALRGSVESPYSAENSGWPNYCSGTTEPSCYKVRYDPDNFTDTPC